MSSAILQLDIKSFWHAGTGLSAGSQSDALCEKDNQGLPVVSGRHLKGLLRHAVHRAECWGWYKDKTLPAGPAPDFETLLFGSRSGEQARSQTLPGMLRLGDAALPAAEAAWLAHRDNGAYRQALFTQLFSTAIDEQGSAKDHSLRSIEVARPLQLHVDLAACITGNSTALQTQQAQCLEEGNWLQILETAISLIDSVGAKRSRGFGEAELTINPAAEGAGK